MWSTRSDVVTIAQQQLNRFGYTLLPFNLVEHRQASFACSNITFPYVQVCFLRFCCKHSRFKALMWLVPDPASVCFCPSSLCDYFIHRLSFKAQRNKRWYDGVIVVFVRLLMHLKKEHIAGFNKWQCLLLEIYVFLISLGIEVPWVLWKGVTRFCFNM